MNDGPGPSETRDIHVVLSNHSTRTNGTTSSSTIAGTRNFLIEKKCAFPVFYRRVHRFPIVDDFGRCR